MNFLRLTILFLFASLLFNCCQGQFPNNEECQENYKKAKNAYSAYFVNNDQEVLNEALSNLEQALHCEKTKSNSIDLKISILMILKDYKKGYQFIDSLKINDFRLPYKKEMNYNYFFAMEYESKGDSLSRNSFFHKTISLIENYIKNKSEIKINEEIYYDLFLTKSKVLTQKQIKQEIKQLKHKYPKSTDFFDILESSLFEDIKIGYFRQ